MNTKSKIFAAKGEKITHVGLVLEVVHETPKQVTGRVIGIFSPTYTQVSSDKTFRIDLDKQRYMLENMKDCEYKFWKTKGHKSRGGYALNGSFKIIDIKSI